MKQIIQILCGLCLLTSCYGTRKQFYNQDARPVGNKNLIEVSIVKIQPTMKGYKHYFKTPDGRIIEKFYDFPLDKTKCHLIDVTNL